MCTEIVEGNWSLSGASFWGCRLPMLCSSLTPPGCHQARTHRGGRGAKRFLIKVRKILLPKLSVVWGATCELANFRNPLSSGQRLIPRRNCMNQMFFRHRLRSKNQHATDSSSIQAVQFNVTVQWLSPFFSRAFQFLNHPI